MDESRNKKRWRVAELIQTSKDILDKNQIDNARLNAELLLGRTLGMERVDLYLNYDRPLTPEELAQYRKMIRRRISHEPLQYILGQTEFMSLEFKVNRSVLIPRAETEVLVEEVIKRYESEGEKWILDLGTGSGNIAVSVAYYLPEVQVVGIDLSRGALKVASENADKHIDDKRVFFVQCDLRDLRFANCFKIRFDAIVSNPPYVSKYEFDFLSPEVGDHEPQIALEQGKNSGYYYEAIANAAPKLLQRGGLVFVEMGYNQAPIVKDIFRQRGFQQLQTYQDLGGIDRVLCVQWTSG